MDGYSSSMRGYGFVGLKNGGCYWREVFINGVVWRRVCEDLDELENAYYWKQEEDQYGFNWF